MSAGSSQVQITDLPSPNCDERPCGIDMLVLHYTGMRSAAEAVARLRDPESRVSSHYVVDEDGSILRLVPEHLRAFHAGVSWWRGRRALNDPSVGVEIVNPGHEWGYRAFPAAQMAAVHWLCLEISARHGILPRDVVAHSDIAPTRKQDPGELFDWRGLAEAGVGLWPDADGEASGNVAGDLVRIGYEHGDEADARAFQRHWLPGNITGQADRKTALRVKAVLNQAATR